MPIASDRESRASQFTDRLVLRVPAVLPRAIEVAATRNLMTSSQYVRRPVIDRLRADGADPAAVRIVTTELT